ncbi:hypothetical protein OJF2_46900 [Aquisphaera giovannonii]|uniref:MAE-28990/MAE-18760-like HEPN domain-containing protein n=2 Tax=Aquisphaera giovannonii TaxID=406548 RepID=A0A5B9W883_9BACT|nr:hypothetical protein OJF2_46900 [Aquisphaera giovannonii]
MTVRGAIPILYAHWEGFVKSLGTAYLEFVLSRNKNFDNLKPNFLALGMKKHLHDATSTLKGRVFVEACDLILAKRSTRAYFLTLDAVETGSNLGYDLFANILHIVGLPFRPEYETARNTIIEPLRQFRNTIAHGKELVVNTVRYNELHQKTFALLALLRDDLDNAVTLKSYLA